LLSLITASYFNGRVVRAIVLRENLKFEVKGWKLNRMSFLFAEEPFESPYPLSLFKSSTLITPLTPKPYLPPNIRAVLLCIKILCMDRWKERLREWAAEGIVDGTFNVF